MKYQTCTEYEKYETSLDKNLTQYQKGTEYGNFSNDSFQERNITQCQIITEYENFSHETSQNNTSHNHMYTWNSNCEPIDLTTNVGKIFMNL